MSSELHLHHQVGKIEKQIELKKVKGPEGTASRNLFMLLTVIAVLEDYDELTAFIGNFLNENQDGAMKVLIKGLDKRGGIEV